MANENNENKTPQNSGTGAAGAPKRKLNIVFRSQNSSTLKELPKNLREAANNPNKGKTEASAEERNSAGGPRPLPAGTKPVKPAVFGSQNASKAGEKQENPMEKKPAEAVSRKADAPASAAKEPKKPANLPKEAEEKKAAAEVKATGSAQIHDEQSPEKSVRNAEAAASKPAEPVTTAADDGLPRIRIVKSYSNYDAKAVIREAQKAADSARAAQQKEQREQRQQRGFQRPSGDGRRPAGAAGDRPRFNNAGGPVQNGQRRPAAGQGGQRGFQPGGGRPQSAGGPRPAASGGFDGTAKPSAGRNGKNVFQNKDRHDKKDRYKDELVLQKNAKTGKGAFIKPEPKVEKPEEDIKVIKLPETLTIKELADKLRLQPSVIIKKLFLEGKMMTPNSDLVYEEAEAIAMEYDILCEPEEKEDVIADLLKEDEEDEQDLVSRSPVVCVMGHVDHGKTSLLDAIRNTNVTSHEAGGITQHIGASVVKHNDRTITFLDTPGHEAFTAMRLRGAQATDIAVLVVAADDGVKPQTIEAISHAKSAGVQVVVAINKVDKPAANIDRVKNELSEYELVCEEWGGSTAMVPVSAKTGEGIEDLLEMILLEADVLELKANPNRKARGIVIEAELDKGRGPVATVLVQKGTLKVGDNVAAGSCFGKVRAMIDDKGNRIRKAGPSMPVEILGLNDVPNAGEVFMGTSDEKEARNIAETFISEHKKQMLEETKSRMNLTDLFDEIQAGNIKELPIIVKADVQGSVEAVKQSLSKLSNEEVAVKVIHSGVGNINESDVNLASAGNAVIIGFNVKPDATSKSIAENENVEIRLYRVIYQAIEDLEAALTGMLTPVFEEEITGHAVVRQVFKSSGVGNIAGCYVTDGIIERGSKARITRGGKMIFDGDIASLKRFKDEVKEVKLGFECGIVFEDFQDMDVDDNIEIYKMKQVKRTAPRKSED